MHAQLNVALRRIGWEEAYRALVPELGRPNARGECTARSPLPDTVDHTPSFFVNITEGIWHCFSSSPDRGGNYVQLYALLHASSFEDVSGRAIPDYERAERELLIQFGIAQPIRPEWIGECRDALWNHLAMQTVIAEHKPWDFRTLYGLNVGYDQETHRIVIPCADDRGAIVNARLYLPGARRDQPKMLWAASHLGGNFLFPHAARTEPVVILTEGEPDAITLRSLGFSGCSGTLGSGQPVPPGTWWRGKDVYIWTDCDTAGREAEAYAASTIIREARSVRICATPPWDGRPANADVSDFVRHLRNTGHDFDGQQRAIIAVLNASHMAPHPHAVFDSPPTEVAFARALSSEHIGRRLSFLARVAARSDRRYLLPTVVNIICPAGGHNFCNRCPMRTEFHGNARFEHDPRAAESLRLIQSDDKGQMDAYKRMHGIPLQCPDPVAITQEATNVEPVMIADTLQDVNEYERVRREAYVILREGEAIEDNRDYRVEGFVYAMPKSQQAVFLLDSARPAVDAFGRVDFTPELIESLKVFQPLAGQPVIERLNDVANDLASSVTQIRGRRDLHLAYRTVYHSILEFPLFGSLLQRGWIECLVIGDTRCGKSMAFKRIAEHYGVGSLIDCKNQSQAGILGSVVTSAVSGERYVVPGILPQQDGRVVCFDEFHGPRFAGGTSIIEALASVRSEGIVTISKAASARFRARVRTIWLGNPGLNKLMSELGQNGVEMVARLIGQPEDIARFDFALAVSQTDVPLDLVNATTPPTPLVFSQEASRALIAWTYTLRPDQVIIASDTEEAIIATAKALYERYDATIPLVEPSDQRTRVAKLAVSIAAQCFSTEDGSQLLVGPHHVDAANQLLRLFFDKPAMGYDDYSQRVRGERVITDEADVRLLFDSVGVGAKRFAEELLRLDTFTERTLGTLVPTQGMMVRSALQILYLNRCVRLIERGRREFYEATPAFTRWLRKFISEA